MSPVPPVIGLDVERVEPAVDGRGIIETGGLAVAQLKKETVRGIEAPEIVTTVQQGLNGVPDSLRYKTFSNSSLQISAMAFL